MVRIKYYGTSAKFINECAFIGKELTNRKIYLHIPFKVLRAAEDDSTQGWCGQ